MVKFAIWTIVIVTAVVAVGAYCTQVLGTL